MFKRGSSAVFQASLLLATFLSVFPLHANDLSEQAAVVVGTTAGNMWYLPVKAISVSTGLTAGLVSFIVTGGDTEVARQTWQNSIDGPYLITPGVAEKAIGKRPELEER